MTTAVAPRRVPPDAAASVRVRLLRPGETEPLTLVFDGLGRRSRELRFLAPVTRLSPAALAHLSSVDDHDHVALVAESLRDGRPVGIARFIRDVADDNAADVAVAVVDSWQRRGVGTLLASALTDRARAVGIRRFALMVRPDNHAAVRLAAGVADATAGEIQRVAADRESTDFVVVLGEEHSAEPHALPA
jgi:RimJ/RimL family protein N-acetyltransferase